MMRTEPQLWLQLLSQAQVAAEGHLVNGVSPAHPRHIQWNSQEMRCAVCTHPSPAATWNSHRCFLATSTQVKVVHHSLGA